MYAGCKTSVLTSAGDAKEIEIEVGFHQGSALSPLLFVIIIDVITEEIDDGTPWAMLFADIQISWINDRQERRSQQRRGEQCSKGMVEMERTEWSDLRQESPNEIEDPDIPDSDSTDTAVRLRNMANVGQR